MKKFKAISTVTGKIGTNPEFYNGKAQVLRLAVYTKQTVNTGDESFEVTIWHNVALFDELALKNQHLLKKGQWVSLSGEISKRKYEGRMYDSIKATAIKAL